MKAKLSGKPMGAIMFHDELVLARYEIQIERILAKYAKLVRHNWPSSIRVSLRWLLMEESQEKPQHELTSL